MCLVGFSPGTLASSSNKNWLPQSFKAMLKHGVKKQKLNHSWNLIVLYKVITAPSVTKDCSLRVLYKVITAPSVTKDCSRRVKINCV